MLTIYEQVQRAIDHIEDHLGDGVTTAGAAFAAHMSVRSFHRYFPALAGCSFGEYVRRRRLATAADALVGTDASVLEIAVAAGYESHEGFTRAFGREFGMPPRDFRERGEAVPWMRRIDLVGTIDQGVLIRSLPDLDAACFRGFRPEPEHEALRKMSEWAGRHPEMLDQHRVFGRNIGHDGQPAHDPDNDGYEVLVTVRHPVPPEEDGALAGTIPAGRFVVTGIEGSFDEDPSGAWITEGWRRMMEMVERNGIQLHPSHRWYEEHLEPIEPGRTRFDLYLEITE